MSVEMIDVNNVRILVIVRTCVANRNEGFSRNKWDYNREGSPGSYDTLTRYDLDPGLLLLYTVEVTINLGVYVCICSSDEETSHLRSEQQQRWGQGDRPRDQRVDRIDSRDVRWVTSSLRVTDVPHALV